MSTSRTINDLPKEIFLNILKKGCEDSLDLASYPEPCSRRLKESACDARQVSKCWKDTIDSVSTWDKSFWIARFLIKVPDKRVTTNLSYFVQDIMKLRYRLPTTQGCDICVAFVMPDCEPDEDYQADKHGEAGPMLPFVRLLIHAMEFISPYQNQIAVLRLEGTNQSSAYFYLWEMITNRWSSCSRLVKIALVSFGVHRVPSDSPFTFPSAQHWDNRLWATYTPINSIRSLAHMHNLDTLEIPSCKWLQGKLVFPPSLSRLRVSDGNEDSYHILFHFLETHPIIRDRIK
jgi:hypothetical protein